MQSATRSGRTETRAPPLQAESSPLWRRGRHRGPSARETTARPIRFCTSGMRLPSSQRAPLSIRPFCLRPRRTAKPSESLVWEPFVHLPRVRVRSCTCGRCALGVTLLPWGSQTPCKTSSLRVCLGQASAIAECRPSRFSASHGQMHERANKEMKLTSVERIGRSQLISSVGPT